MLARRTILLSLIVLLCLPVQAARQLRVLSVGNSYSVDAFIYMPFVMKAMAPDINFTLGILYRSSASLQKHWNGRSVLPDGVTQTYYECVNARAWKDRGTYTLEQLTDTEAFKWDVIILQQASNYSRNYGFYQPYLNYLISWIRERTELTSPLLGWLMTPAYPDGYFGLGSSSSDRMYYDIAACAQRVIDQTDTDFLLPCGTAIQNARHTDLDSIGKFGHLSYDGLHLQEGLPCLIDCYTATAALLQAIGRNADIGDDYLDINIDWLRIIGKPDYRGELSESALDYPCRLLARQAVNDALTEPYEITYSGWWTTVPTLPDNQHVLPIHVNGRTLTADTITHVTITDPAAHTRTATLPITLMPGIYIITAQGFAPKTILIQ